MLASGIDKTTASNYDYAMATKRHALFRYSPATHITILAGQFPILITWRGAVEESIRK